MENITKSRWMSTSVLVKAGLLAALSIVFTRVFSFMIPLAGLPALRIGFGTLPITISGILFGPLVGGLVGMVSDLVGFMINPMGGSYFPGFTLSAALEGIIPGLLFYWIKKKERNISFNLVNGIAIIAFAMGVIGIMVQNEVLAITSGGMMYNGAPLSLIVVVLFGILVAAFVMMPVYLTKHQGKDSEDSRYSLDKITFAITVQYLIVSLTLNTLWLSMLYQKGFLIFLPGRILAGFVMIPMLSLLLFSVSRLFKYVR